MRPALWLGLVIAVVRRRMTLRGFWEALLETGHITAAILFLITAASIYSRMLGLAGLPNELSDILNENPARLLLDHGHLRGADDLSRHPSGHRVDHPDHGAALPAAGRTDGAVAWSGSASSPSLAPKSGFLTPPLGISCFVIKATLDDDRIKLKDVFLGALPFAFVMLIVLIVLIRFPGTQPRNPELKRPTHAHRSRKDNITDVFLRYFGKDTDPRMREIMASLAKHLHAFAKEVRLTHAEWQTGIDFMECMAGQFTDAERHEFVLLSDVLGLSSLVDMINSVPEGTSSSVLGPFHISGAPDIPLRVTT